MSLFDRLRNTLKARPTQPVSISERIIDKRMQIEIRRNEIQVLEKEIGGMQIEELHLRHLREVGAI